MVAVTPPRDLEAQRFAMRSSLIQLGAAHVSQFVSGRDLQRIQRAVGRIPTRRMPQNVGLVRQDAYGAVFERPSMLTSPVLQELARSIAAELHTCGEGSLATWWPQEMTIMRYEDERDGISAHLDGRRYGLVVAILSVRGQAQLDVVPSRYATEPLASFACHVGDLVLLRAPGFGGLQDGRPFHSVVARKTPRISLTLRMLAEAA